MLQKRGKTMDKNNYQKEYLIVFEGLDPDTFEVKAHHPIRVKADDEQEANLKLAQCSIEPATLIWRVASTTELNNIQIIE